MELHTESKTFKSKAIEIPSLSTNQKLAFNVRGKKNLCCSQSSLCLGPVERNLTKHITGSCLPNCQIPREFNNEQFPNHEVTHFRSTNEKDLP